MKGFAVRKLNSFFWGGAINLFNEVYICLSYSFFINSYRLVRFESLSFGANSVFAILSGIAIVFGPALIVRSISKMWEKNSTLRLNLTDKIYVPDEWVNTYMMAEMQAEVNTRQKAAQRRSNLRSKLTKKRRYRNSVVNKRRKVT